MGWGALQSFGTYLPYILDKFGGTRARASVVHSILIGASLVTGVASGILVKKAGTGFTTFIGAICLAGGFALSYIASDLVVLYATIGVIAGIGESLTYVSAVVVTGRLFGKKRQTLFLSIQNITTGVAGIVLPYFLDALVLSYGLNGAFLIQGGIMLNIMNCALLFHRSKEKPALSNVGFSNAAENGANSQDSPEVDIRVSLTSLTFVFFTISEVLAMANFIGTFVIYMDILTFKNIPHSKRLACLIGLNVSSTAGRFIPVLVRMITRNPLYTVLISVLCGMTGQIILLLSTSFPLIMIGSIFTGVTDGATISAASVVVFKIVLPESQAFAYGLIHTSIGIISIGIGPFYGWIYDVTGSYSRVMIISSSIYFLTVLFIGVCIIQFKRLKK